MELKTVDGFEYFQYTQGAFKVIFFTAEGNKSFNINTQEGLTNIDEVKRIFNLEDIGYCIQIHSDIIWNYDGEIKQGDSILTNKENLGLGVFTADCVPVIIVDENNKVIAAVHSGWKGTYEEITLKTIKEMGRCYGSRAEELFVFIGPHIRDCCYEVGNEVPEKFKSKGYQLDNIMKDGKLSLENCIISQCIKAGILENRIISEKCCTMCSEKNKYHSYRRNKTDGRLLSLVFF